MTAKELIDQVNCLPVVSQAANKLMSLLSDQDHHIDDLVRTIRTDQVLTANMLRLCNSASIRGDDPISSLDQAALRLGQQEITRIVLVLSFGKALERQLPGYAIAAEELWRHSLVTAIAAQYLVDQGHGRHIDPSVAFTAGLLHDIGKLAMDQVLTPEAQTSIRERVQVGNFDRVQAEHEVLGVTHSEVGALLLERWLVPADVVDAVAKHHEVSLDKRSPLASVLQAANAIAHLLGSAPGWDGLAVGMSDNTFEAVQLSSEELQQTIIAVHELLSDTQRFLFNK